MKALLATLSITNVLGAYAVVTCNDEHSAELHLPGEDVAKPIRSILTECVIGEQVLGGEAYINGVSYEIYHTELRERDIRGDPELDSWMESLQERDLVEGNDDHDDGDEQDEDDEEQLEGRDLESRGRGSRGGRGGRTRPSRVKRPKTTRPKTTRPKTTKPKQKCPTGQVAKPGQKQPRAPGGKKQPAGANAGASCQAEEKLNCKTILARLKAKNAREKLTTRDLDGGSDSFVGSIVHSLQKRENKSGSACRQGERTFNARSYPDHNSPAMVCGPDTPLSKAN